MQLMQLQEWDHWDLDLKPSICCGELFWRLSPRPKGPHICCMARTNFSTLHPPCIRPASTSTAPSIPFHCWENLGPNWHIRSIIRKRVLSWSRPLCSCMKLPAFARSGFHVPFPSVWRWCAERMRRRSWQKSPTVSVNNLSMWDAASFLSSANQLEVCSCCESSIHIRCSLSKRALKFFSARLLSRAAFAHVPYGLISESDESSESGDWHEYCTRYGTCWANFEIHACEVLQSSTMLWDAQSRSMPLRPASDLVRCADNSWADLDAGHEMLHQGYSNTQTLEQHNFTGA